MKKIILGITSIGLLVAATTAFSGESVVPDCAMVAESVKASIKEDSSKVLTVVAVKVAESPDCACEIVKAAIVESRASNDLTGQIVETAVRAAPRQYKTIVECAVAVNPDAAAQIRAALQNIFGSKGGKGGKVVIVPDALPRMSPALAMAFILDGLTPQQGYDLAMGMSFLPGGVPFGSGSGLASGLRTTGSVPGGNTPGIFTIETPVPGGGTSGGGGGSTPSNPL